MSNKFRFFETPAACLASQDSDGYWTVACDKNATTEQLDRLLLKSFTRQPKQKTKNTDLCDLAYPEIYYHQNASPQAQELLSNTPWCCDLNLEKS